MDVTTDMVKSLLDGGTKPSDEFNSVVASKVDDFTSTNNKKPNNSEMKYIYASCFVDMHDFS